MFNLNFLREYSDPSINSIVTAIFIGIFIAIFVVYFEKAVYGRFVRSIIKNKAFCESSAKTREELSCKSFIFKFAVRDKSSFLKLVKKIKGENKNEDRFYIPEEKKDFAEIKYRKKGNDIFALIFALVILIALATVVRLYGEKIVNFIYKYLQF